MGQVRQWAVRCKDGKYITRAILKMGKQDEYSAADRSDAETLESLGVGKAVQVDITEVAENATFKLVNRNLEPVECDNTPVPINIAGVAEDAILQELKGIRELIEDFKIMVDDYLAKIRCDL